MPFPAIQSMTWPGSVWSSLTIKTGLANRRQARMVVFNPAASWLLAPAL
jgi:hypothetical protein